MLVGTVRVQSGIVSDVAHLFVGAGDGGGHAEDNTQTTWSPITNAGVVRHHVFKQGGTRRPRGSPSRYIVWGLSLLKCCMSPRSKNDVICIASPTVLLR